MKEMLKVEEVGLFPPDDRLSNAIILKSTEDSLFGKRALYSLYSTYIERVRNLLTGEYDSFNLAEKTIFDFLGKSVKKEELTTAEEPKYVFRGIDCLSNLEFSDGTRLGPILPNNSLPTTLLNRGTIEVERGLFDSTKSGISGWRLKRNFQKYMKESVKFEKTSNIRYDAKQQKPEIPVNDYLEYNITGVTPAVMRTSTAAQPVESGTGPITLAQRTEDVIFAKLENRGAEYSIQLPFQENIINNAHIKFKEDEQIRIIKTKLDSQDIISYGSLMERVVGDARIKNVFIEAQKFPGFQEEYLMYPFRCFITLERGSETISLEAPKYLGLSLWTREFPPLLIKEINIQTETKKGHFVS